MTAALSRVRPDEDGDYEAEIIRLRPAPRWHDRLQAAAALLALPLAVALTVWLMGRPAAETREPVGFAAPVVRVAVMASPETTSVARRVASTLASETTEITFEAGGAVDTTVTRVVYYEPAFADEAAEVQARLGPGTLLLGPVLEEHSADVTVVVGKDLAPA